MQIYHDSKACAQNTIAFAMAMEAYQGTLEQMPPSNPCLPPTPKKERMGQDPPQQTPPPGKAPPPSSLCRGRDLRGNQPHPPISQGTKPSTGAEPDQIKPTRATSWGATTQHYCPYPTPGSPAQLSWYPTTSLPTTEPPIPGPFYPPVI